MSAKRRFGLLWNVLVQPGERWRGRQAPIMKPESRTQPSFRARLDSHETGFGRRPFATFRDQSFPTPGGAERLYGSDKARDKARVDLDVKPEYRS